MYKTGDLKLVTKDCATTAEDGICDESWDEAHKHRVYDSRNSGRNALSYPTVYLPHSCDEWVIGGREELLRLQEDIAALLEVIE